MTSKGEKVANQVVNLEGYKEQLKDLKTADDAMDFLKRLVAPTLQAMLEAEMDQHLGYSKHEAVGDNTGNSRNGYYDKKIRTNSNQATIKVPRDRNGEFEPVAVKKYQSSTSELDDKIISMYAKGMTTRDIHDHMKDIYGVEVSAEMVSIITDKVMPLVKEWQSRPLESIYTIVYLDAVHFKVRESGRITNRAAYVMMGIKTNGNKDIIGIWVGENEGSKYWLSLLNEIKNRGVNDILICCMDGLTGFSEAINTIFPKANVQRCIVHQIRNTCKYVPHKDKKKFCNDLKSVYRAPCEKAGLEALEEMKNKWPQYKLYLKSWETNWGELSTFFVYPEEIRKIIYTTNPIENLNRQFRKVTKTTSIFPHNESLLKLLWLAQRDITKKWTMPARNWGQILGQFSVLFPDKIIL